ncbi:PBP1A family penicillin-binding protein [Candidatus Daviesbacteria bacterium]|nr:PBP1A family penicillin-binding protein [Candidatus Daviesbacteria bacterium]
MLLVIAVVIFFATQIPSPENLTSRDVAQATKIYDRQGELLYDIFQNQNRTPVKLADVPDVVKQATISIEDKDFYKHGGFSVTGIARSGFDLLTSRRVEGGSTLTQQLVKNALLSGERTVTRKIKELILAIQVERSYSKDQILEMYLNEIPYGGTAYGVEAAANLYFGKHAKDLDLAEAALLAGLPQSPSVYSPYGTHPELAKVRQQEVLRRMSEDSYITKAQADASYKEQLTYRTAQNEVGFKAPHFVLYVKQKLIEQFGDKLVEQGGLKVTTTLDYELQQKAQDIVRDQIDKLKGYNVGNGAAVVIDPKAGQILAMVGSKDYFAKSLPDGCSEGQTCTFEPNVNAALALRQPGSATKPITYSVGLQKGYTAATVLEDVKTTFPGGAGHPAYVPVNYDGKFRGPIQVRYALGNSINIPAVKMLAMVGVKNVMDQAFKMGISSWEPTEQNVNSVGLSLTLGGRELRLIDLTSAFGVFATKGIRHDPVSILKVTDAKGKTLYEYQPSDGTKVLDENIAFIISNILSDNGARSEAFGPSSVLNVSGHTVAVKTGTTDEKKDNWAVGYTPSVVVGVWVGNNNNEKMNPAIASGITGASPIWHDIMTVALQGKSNEQFDASGGVSYIDIDGLMGGKPHGGSPTRKEYFIKGTEPNAESSAYQNARVCKNNPHRLSGDGEDGDQKDVIVLKEDDPTGANQWQAGIDAWVLTAPNPALVGATKGCSGIPNFSGGGTGGVISIVNVANGANVPRVFDVLAQTNSPGGVKKVTWMIDGAVKSTGASAPFAFHVEFPVGDKGSHTITATLEDNNGGTFSTSIGVTVAL